MTPNFQKEPNKHAAFWNKVGSDDTFSSEPKPRNFTLEMSFHPGCQFIIGHVANYVKILGQPTNEHSEDFRRFVGHLLFVSGWWFQPLWKTWVDLVILKICHLGINSKPNRKQTHVPNHQADMFFNWVSRMHGCTSRKAPGHLWSIFVYLDVTSNLGGSVLRNAKLSSCF